MISSKDFIKHLKTLDFPNIKYTAIQSYPGTKIVNSIYINDFLKKYKKKFIYDHEDKNIVQNNVCNKLFDISFSYISNFQINLLKNGIESYISGGSALKLYSLYSGIKDTSNIFRTKDYDMYLYINKTIRMNNRIIFENLFKVIDSIILYPRNPKYSFLEFYILVHFQNINKFNEVIKIFIDKGYDLYLYNPKVNNNTYSFKFLKLMNKEFCIRIKIKFTDITHFIKEKIYSYTKITYYYIKKIENEFKVVNKYIPIEILFKNKNNSNLDLMKNTIYLNNKLFYLYNVNTLLYNLIHLYYKYTHNTGNITINRKKEEGKNIRDKKRLIMFFKIYCNLIYPNLSNKDINGYLIKIIDNNNKFSKNIENIVDFKMITDIFNKY